MKTDEIASKFLGKRVSGSETYDPSLLVVVPRAENRKQYDIKNEKLPFVGVDVWHVYEFSTLTESGLPVTRVMKMKYSCENKFLVESKSLKLYLNSFNMSRFGKNTEDCLEVCKNIIERDLSEKLKTPVTICFLSSNVEKVEIYQDFKNIMDFVDENAIKIDKFKEATEVLEVEKSAEVAEYRWTFESLRSNCRVTHQPDFGDAFIYYKSKKHIKEESLVKYLSSFRSEFHFHEECCEMIFKRLSDLLEEGDELFVSILYTRRGGIDICPSRWRKNTQVADAFNLTDVTKFARGCLKQ